MPWICKWRNPANSICKCSVPTKSWRPRWFFENRSTVYFDRHTALWKIVSKSIWPGDKLMSHKNLCSTGWTLQLFFKVTVFLPDRSCTGDQIWWIRRQWSAHSKCDACLRKGCEPLLLLASWSSSGLSAMQLVCPSTVAHHGPVPCFRWLHQELDWGRHLWAADTWF